MSREEDIEGIIHMIDLYLQDNFNIISKPDFEDLLLEGINLLCDNIDIDDLFEDALYYYYLYFMPRREFQTTFVYNKLSVDEIRDNLLYLQGKLQPAQYTPEWYE